MLLIKSQADLAKRYRMYGNKLDPAATEAYIAEVYEGHYKRFKEDFGETLLGFFSDEPAFHNLGKKGEDIIGCGNLHAGYPWHDDLMPIFDELYKENTCAMLCRLWYDFADGSHMSVREQFMDTVTVKAGENLLEITVANTCVYGQSDKFSRYMLIKPSGLLGPVTVR